MIKFEWPKYSSRSTSLSTQSNPWPSRPHSSAGAQLLRLCRVKLTAASLTALRLTPSTSSTSPHRCFYSRSQTCALGVAGDEGVMVTARLSLQASSFRLPLLVSKGSRAASAPDTSHVPSRQSFGLVCWASPSTLHDVLLPDSSTASTQPSSQSSFRHRRHLDLGGGPSLLGRAFFPEERTQSLWRPPSSGQPHPPQLSLLPRHDICTACTHEVSVHRSLLAPLLAALATARPWANMYLLTATPFAADSAFAPRRKSHRHVSPQH